MVKYIKVCDLFANIWGRVISSSVEKSFENISCLALETWRWPDITGSIVILFFFSYYLFLSLFRQKLIVCMNFIQYISTHGSMVYEVTRKNYFVV